MAWLVFNKIKEKWFAVMGNFDQAYFDKWGAILSAGFYYVYDSHKVEEDTSTFLHMNRRQFTLDAPKMFCQQRTNGTHGDSGVQGEGRREGGIGKGGIPGPGKGGKGGMGQ